MKIRLGKGEERRKKNVIAQLFITITFKRINSLKTYKSNYSNNNKYSLLCYCPTYKFTIMYTFKATDFKCVFVPFPNCTSP